MIKRVPGQKTENSKQLKVTERDWSIVGKSNMGKMSVINVIITEYALLTVIIIVCIMLCNASTAELDIV